MIHVVLCTHMYICQNYKKESHNNLWWYNPISHVNIRLTVRPPALCSLYISARTVCHAWAMLPSCFCLSMSDRADQPDLLSSGAKVFQWMSPSWRNLITSPVCEVSRSLKKLCILQANPVVQEASLFLWSAFLSPNWFLPARYDAGHDESKTLNLPAKNQMSSQTSASSPGPI